MSVSPWKGWTAQLKKYFDLSVEYASSLRAKPTTKGKKTSKKK